MHRPSEDTTSADRQADQLGSKLMPASPIRVASRLISLHPKGSNPGLQLDDPDRKGVYSKETSRKSEHFTIVKRFSW
jgi:hypothetical protein